MRSNISGQQINSNGMLLQFRNPNEYISKQAFTWYMIIQADLLNNCLSRDMVFTQ